MSNAETLRSLHHGPQPLVLPNAWDVASARAVVGAGFPVVATSSGAVAATLGFPDGDALPPELAFAVVERIAAAVEVPVTADVEAGYGLPMDELAHRLAAAGAVGCNFEDTDHGGDGPLVDGDVQAERIAALKSAGPDLVVNARVDTFLHQAGSPEEQLAEALRRGRLYRDAGADCIYPITCSDETALATLVEELGTLNVMHGRGAPPLARLAELGVARVSLAGGLFRSLHRRLQDDLVSLRGELDDLSG